MTEMTVELLIKELLKDSRKLNGSWGSNKKLAKYFKTSLKNIEDAKKKIRVENLKNKKSPAKILLFDLETSPYLGYFWDLWQPTIQYDDLIHSWKLLTFSAKWLFEENIITDRLTKKELETLDDSRITKNLWKLIDEATVIVAHNLKKFDKKRANAKFLEHKLAPPASYLMIDTLEHARKQFALPSNRLDSIGKFLGVGQKIETRKGLWTDVMNKDYDALIEMDRYCQGDIFLLEDIYLEIRPYIQPHPNISINITKDISACPTCGSTDLKNEDKPYLTTVSQYDLFRCNNCNSLSRNRKTSKILSSIP